MKYSRELKLDSITDENRTELVFEKARFISKTMNPICACDVDLSRYQISPLIKPTEYSLRYIAFPSYIYDTTNKQQGRFIVLSKPITIRKGSGIARPNAKWGTTDNDCMHFWLAHDVDDEGINELFEKVLLPLDNYHIKKIKTEKNADFVHVITKSGEKQKLQKNIIYEKSIILFDDIENSKRTYGSIKIRFDVEYDVNIKHNEPKKIKTKLFLTKSDGTRRDQSEPIETLDDIRKYFVRNCKAQFVLEINKFWVDINQRGLVKKEHKCGYTIKCREIIILDHPDVYKTRSMFTKYITKKESNTESEKDIDDVKNVLHI